ncbi:MAG: hypothetical protein K8F36_03275 [Melioribacteraceae bacterium]|nr:hypothetical protein [Melioribacteraceae bacterium]
MDQTTLLLASGEQEFNNTRKGLPDRQKLNKIRERITDKYYNSDFILSKIAERILIEIN